MSNNLNNEGHKGHQVRPGIPLAVSAADMQAAETLLYFSQVGPNRTAVAQPQPASKDENDQTLTSRLESICLTGEGAFGRPYQPKDIPLFAAPSTSDPMAQLVERLRDISFAHLNHPQGKNGDHRSTFGTLNSPHVIGYYRCSEVPEEIGRFIDLWGARGYKPEGILNMLLLNNVIVPYEYLYGRLAYGTSYTDSNLRSTFGGEWDAPAGPTATPQAAHNGGDMEMDGECDDDSTQSWEDQLEQWCEWH